MTLEDTVKQIILHNASVASALTTTEKRIEAGKNPTEDGLYTPELMQAILTLGENPIETPEELDLIINRTPERISRDSLNEKLPGARKNSYSALSEILETDNLYEEVMNEAGDLFIYNIGLREAPAIKIEGNEDHNKIVEAKESYDTWREADENDNTAFYKENVKNAVLQAAIENLSDEQIVALQLIKGRTSLANQMYIENFADKEGQADMAKVRGYFDVMRQNANEEQLAQVNYAIGSSYLRRVQTEVAQQQQAQEAAERQTAENAPVENYSEPELAQAA